MTLTACTMDQAPEILAILNDAIANSTALYDYQPRTMDMMAAWFAAKEKGNFPVIGLVAASLTMIGINVVAGRSPHGLAVGIEKAKPDYDIIGVGAKRVPRADARQRQIEKEAIQITIVQRGAAQDQRHVGVEAFSLAALANSDYRHQRKTLPRPPPGS